MMRKLWTTFIIAAITAALFFVPGPRCITNDGARSVRAEVVAVNDADVQTHGYVEYGTQHLEVRMNDGTIRRADNELRAQLDLDKKFKTGDTALVILPANDDGEATLIVRDHWRMGWGFLLFGAFAVLLAAFGGWTGVRALLSFVISCLVVWKVLIPLVLNGYSAMLVSFISVAVLTAVIMYLVAGWTKKGLVAFIGSMLGVIASLGLAVIFSLLMNVNGATMPFSQALLYVGSLNVDLQDIFIGAIILASSGAVMDLGMDIASGIAEVRLHNPALSRRELLRSGLAIGKAVVGTMTTTLLLAYSGGYLTLLMVFATQGTHPLDFLNSTLVSAEVVKTLVGSFGLVLVAPFTALVGAWVYSPRKGA